jgi:hypothetical protein
MDEPGEEILSELGDHQLGRRGEQIHLDEVEQSLNREQNEQADRDPVEQGGVRGYERCVEQAPDYLRKCECDRGAAQQTDESDYQAREKWANARNQSAKRSWRRDRRTCAWRRSLR